MNALQTLLIIFGLLNLPFAGFLYLHSDRRAATTFYVLISFFASLWSISTFLTNAGLPEAYFRYPIYGHYIFGYLAYLSFFWFALFFPEKPKAYSVVIGLILTLASAVFLAFIPITGFLFQDLHFGSALSNEIVFSETGYVAFILALSSVFFIGLVVLLWKLRGGAKPLHSDGLSSYQIYFALLANLVAGVLGISLNLLLPLYGNFSLFYINPIFVTLALIALGFYNLLRYHLFRAKIVLTEFFSAGIWILFFTRLLDSTTRADFAVNLIILLISIFFGAFLIDSVLREVKLREETEKLAHELEETNERQEVLFHFMSHEVKGFLTKDEGAFAALADGDFGPLPESLKSFVSNALAQTRQGARSVTDILKASNQKKGTTEYKKEPVDLKALTAEAVESARSMATAKGLTLTFSAVDSQSYQMTGDKAEIGDHVLRNLVENAINYTPKGSIGVLLKKDGNKYVIAVKDTGVGITEEDKKRLFTEGGHGKDSQKINVHSTGYGLFIAKNIVEAHGGTIRAESEGQDKGSTFIVELPA